MPDNQSDAHMPLEFFSQWFDPGEAGDVVYHYCLSPNRTPDEMRLIVRQPGGHLMMPINASLDHKARPWIVWLGTQNPMFALLVLENPEILESLYGQRHSFLDLVAEKILEPIQQAPGWVKQMQQVALVFWLEVMALHGPHPLLEERIRPYIKAWGRNPLPVPTWKPSEVTARLRSVGLPNLFPALFPSETEALCKNP